MGSLLLPASGEGKAAGNLFPVQLAAWVLSICYILLKVPFTLPEGRPAHRFSDSTEVALFVLRVRQVCTRLVLSAWHSSLEGGLCVPHFNTDSALWTMELLINDCWGSWDLNVL